MVYSSNFNGSFIKLTFHTVKTDCYFSSPADMQTCIFIKISLLYKKDCLQKVKRSSRLINTSKRRT